MTDMAEVTELIWHKWHPLTKIVSVAFQRIYPFDRLPEVPDEYKSNGMYHDDEDAFGVTILRRLYMPARRIDGGAAIFPMGDVPPDVVHANIEFRRSSKPKNRLFMAAARFPSPSRPETSAFGFDLNGGNSNFLRLTFPGIDGSFAPLFFKILRINEEAAEYLKITADIDVTGDWLRVWGAVVEDDEVPGVLRAVKFTR